MAKSKTVVFNGTFFLQLVLAGFFIILGIMGIAQNMDEGAFGLKGVSQPVEIIFGVLELICGVVLLGGLFFNGLRSYLRLSSLLILIFWIVRIVLSKITAGFQPASLYWWLYLFVELIILMSALAIRDRYA